ncbi:MAG: secretin and TonB N-terminal domain-containing protein [Planctomycetaceae bacterium]|nr:secretin and TonB N-terminal domain-containing protein [Planctomycetaceae bacterium]
MLLVAGIYCALIKAGHTAESPRYPKTTQLGEQTPSASPGSTSPSFTNKVKNFFKREKSTTGTTKKYGVRQSDITPSTGSSEQKYSKSAESEVDQSVSGRPASEIELNSPRVSHSSNSNPNRSTEIPLEVRPFKLDMSTQGTRPAYPFPRREDHDQLSRFRRVNFEAEENRPEDFQVNSDQAVPPPLVAPPTNFKPTRVPLEEIPQSDAVRITNEDDLISLIVRDAPVGTVLSLIAENQGVNIITSGEVGTRISVTVNRVTLEDALNAILASTGYTWIRKSGIIIISPISGGAGSSSQVHGKVLRVFNLNFLSAVDVDKTVQGLLSPVGKSFQNETASNDTRRTQETIIVEDLPEYVDRIAAYIAQTDVPPRQVMIEARILEVDLRNEMSHGVNLTALAELAGAKISFKTQGFASPIASPAFLFGIDGTDLDALLEALQTTTDTKTLANPKLLVLNGQEARIQIGGQLGYLVTTTTETSTLQNVQFLDVGVVLSVTPRISDDRRVMMVVKPEVSEGQINLLTGLPEEETTEVETSVMVASGEGMVIGGLIKETDNDIQNKIPILGDLWGVGRLFQRRRTERRRTEIIIVLTPHILPYTYDKYCEHEVEIDRVMTPLLEGQLQPLDRPWEAKLPDAIHDPRKIDWERLKHLHHDLKQPYPKPIEYYVPSVQEKHGLQPYSGPVIYPNYPELSQVTGQPQAKPTDSFEQTPLRLEPAGVDNLKYAVKPIDPEQEVNHAFQTVGQDHPIQQVSGEIGGDEIMTMEWATPDKLFRGKNVRPLYQEADLKPVMEELRHE